MIASSSLPKPVFGGKGTNSPLTRTLDSLKKKSFQQRMSKKLQNLLFANRRHADEQSSGQKIKKPSEYNANDFFSNLPDVFRARESAEVTTSLMMDSNLVSTTPENGSTNAASLNTMTIHEEDETTELVAKPSNADSSTTKKSTQANTSVAKADLNASRKNASLLKSALRRSKRRKSLFNKTRSILETSAKSTDSKVNSFQDVHSLEQSADQGPAESLVELVEVDQVEADSTTAPRVPEPVVEALKEPITFVEVSAKENPVISVGILSKPFTSRIPRLASVKPRPSKISVEEARKDVVKAESIEPLDQSSVVEADLPDLPAQEPEYQPEPEPEQMPEIEPEPEILRRSKRRSGSPKPAEPARKNTRGSSQCAEVQEKTIPQAKTRKPRTKKTPRLSLLQAIKSPAGPRRSGRCKIDRYSKPVYGYEAVKDYDGNSVLVWKIVGTNKRANIIDEKVIESVAGRKSKKRRVSSKKAESKRNAKKDIKETKATKKPKEVEKKKSETHKPAKSSKSTKSKAELKQTTLDYEHWPEREFSVVEDSFEKPHKASKAKRNLTESMNHYQVPLSVDASLEINVSRLIDTSSESIAIYDRKTGKTVGTGTEKLICKSSLNHMREFKKFTDGVQIHFINESTCVLKFAKFASTLLNQHDKTITYFAQNGSFVFWREGILTKHSPGDLVIIPPGLRYKIRACSPSSSSYMTFRFQD